MIIDATNMIVGRLATYIAKQALLGNKIDVVNSEKAVISGTKKDIFARFTHKVERGSPKKGPYYPRMPHMILKRSIRGMLPYKQEKGRKAFKAIKCHPGIPEELEGKEIIKLDQYHKSKLLKSRTVTLEEVSKRLGRK